MQNTNDYPLSSERLEAGPAARRHGRWRDQRDSTLPMAMDTISTIALPIPLGQQATPERLRKLGNETHTFAVRGQAIFQTPIGKRKVAFCPGGIDDLWRPLGLESLGRSERSSRSR